MIGAAKKACKEVHKVQQKALREKFKW
jgi:hypothetical protein